MALYKPVKAKLCKVASIKLYDAMTYPECTMPTNDSFSNNESITSLSTSLAESLSSLEDESSSSPLLIEE